MHPVPHAYADAGHHPVSAAATDQGASAVTAAVLALALLGGCAGFAPRMRLVSSDATEATWSLVVEDRGGAAQLLIDGRPRVDGCDRAGVTLRCELRGMFPGGHTVELRLAGAVLKRSTIIGPALSSRPMLVRARELSAIATAGHVGADGVVLPAGLDQGTLEQLVEASHKAGLRVFVEGSEAQTAGLVARYSIDGLVGAPIDARTMRHFPSARALWIDETASLALAAHRDAQKLPLRALGSGAGLLEAKGLLQAALALIAGRGAIVDATAAPLLEIRRHHKALREGTIASLYDDEVRRAVKLTAGKDAVTLVCNAGSTPFSPSIELPTVPIDLLGGPMTPTGPTVPPGDVAALLASPEPDRTHY